MSICVACGRTTVEQAACPTCHGRVPTRPAPERVRGKVIGYRHWRLDGYRLGSLNVGGAYWTLGENHAQCLAYAGLERKPHDAPDPGCMCGLYAFHAPIPVASLSGMVAGMVQAWGRIEVHRSGFRAEYAQPVLLYYSPTEPYEYVTRLQAVAEEMGLPLVKFGELKARAAEFGEPIPESLRPARPYLYPGGTMYLGASVGAHLWNPPPLPSVPPLPSPTRAQKGSWLVGLGVNAGAATLNLSLFVSGDGRWWNALAAGVCGVIAGVAGRAYWRARR